MNDRIFLFNHGGSGNHGCEALVRTTVEFIRSIKTEAAIELQSEAPEEDFFYGIDHVDGVSGIVPAMHGIQRGSFDYVKAYLDLKLKHDYFPMDVLPYLETIRNISKGSVGISIGGDNYCYSNYPKYIRIHRQIAAKCPTILFGCSLESELFTDRDLTEDLKTYDLITARESVTYGLLKEAGLEQVLLMPDTAFFLLPDFLPLPEGFQEGNTIGINISPLIIKRETVPGIILENCRELIRYLIKHTDSSIALIPHVVQKSSDDREVLHLLYEEFKDTERILMIGDCNCRKLKGYIARCRFMIAARTHASIAAYSSGVPTIVLGYSAKSAGIAKDLFGTDEGYVVPVSRCDRKDQLLEAFHLLEAKEDCIRNRLRSAQTDFSERLHSFDPAFRQVMKGI